MASYRLVHHGISSFNLGSRLSITYLICFKALYALLSLFVSGSRRDDEWWQVLMSLNFLVGFLAGGVASHFAFQVNNGIMIITCVSKGGTAL